MSQPPNQSKSWMPFLLGGAGTIALVSGMVISTQVNSGDRSGGLFNVARVGQPTAPLPGSAIKPSPIIAPLLKQMPQQRAQNLQKIAQTAQPSMDRSRARYVLATDHLAANQPQAALKQLANLEQDYPVLTAKILHLRGLAFMAAKQPDQAKAAWQIVLQKHGNDPAAAEVLYELGKTAPQYWDQAIKQFPTHPRTVAIVKKRLKQNPKQLPLLLLLAKAEPDAKGTPARMDQLVKLFGPQLQPQQWQTVAWAYWESQVYDRAAKAYAKAPQTPETAYRSARGLHLKGEKGGKQRYEMTIKQFPGTSEAGLALTRLAQLVPPKQALPYLDQVIASYPDRAPQALLEKAKLLDKMRSSQSATQLRQYLLEKFPKSKAAAQLRWTIAQDRLKAGDMKVAQQWAAETLTHSTDAKFGARAGFWAGKWALKLGDSQKAANTFQQVIKQHPESYYAWRSASLLGWNVGDFTTVRKLQPAIQQPTTPPQLLAGSAALQELHQIGQRQAAWSYWQVEFQNRLKPTVPEQFTDGILRLGVGDNLDGLYMVGSLSDRDQPAEQQQYLTLKATPDYWHSLYPFPFAAEISSWSKQHRLNPMLVTALMRQESRFEPQIKSSVGATGLMQVMPETASFIAGKLNVKNYNLENPADNIKLGTWYLGYTHDEYDGNSMLAVASYNAGPGAVGGWLEKRKTQDADEFVEAIPYSETRGYVRAVLGNYWNYLRLYNPEIAKKVAQISPHQPKLNQ
ncbi:transglycosylase SLT domain-containing protein [filamentous cyanobacterium LEGE 11480]|uniref:Transglycosylase SLT domain-containing protein n=1 Tax=Romeriopsis navalis LEGE 11480 TaxID=2777977 RepID=A0A928VPM7_9CYAN|nr:transglycosylase SLT domain-containing protein [Romeriopsis navalis]MBE9030581.1 transglycosylase SLT domain-containing protein [Romeriopsis navalis LEGE 11480]